MTDAIELKPCPFCGGAARHKAYKDKSRAGYNIVDWREYGCAECRISFKFPADYHIDPKELWNARPIEDELRAQILSLHAEAGDAACRATQMAAGSRAAAFVVEELRARISALEVSLTAEKKSRHLADRLIHERDARLEEAGKRIATLENLLSQLANAVTTYRTGITNHAVGQAQADMAEAEDLAQKFLHTEAAQ
jgi:hypothetical protein